MGVDSRRPILPAPTDSMIDTTGGSATETGTDIATDVSRRTDKTSYSIPDDGSPITISTRRKHREDRLSHGRHQSQTSLLIEYFEGGKSGDKLSSRPSVRVKVTPSAARKLKDDHIQIRESGGRKPTYRRRISLGKDIEESKRKLITEGGLDEQSVSSLASGSRELLEGHGPPVEIEVNHASDISDTDLSANARYYQPNSEISSMPADSMLEGTSGISSRMPRVRSRSTSREEVMADSDLLKTPSRRRSRSLSRERITRKVIEKLGDQKAESRSKSSGKRRTSHGHHKSRSRSVSKELLESEVKSPRHKSGRYRDEDISSADPSLLSSTLSANRKSADAYSFRSGTSKSSINNPKLLETVEDAIRRLILPELKELKKDQKVQTNRSKFERDGGDSAVSGSNVSKDSTTRKLSKHSSAPDVAKTKKVSSKDSTELSPESISRRRKERRRERELLGSPSDRSYDEHESVDTVMEGGKVHKKKSKDHRLRDAGAAALVGGALTAAALKSHDSRSSVDRKERRKRRSKSRSSRSASIAESEDIFTKHDTPPMPLRSEVDSELTRDSLLSAQTASTSTPRQRAEVREVVRGSPREVLSPARTPTRTPLGRNSIGLLGARHGNSSSGNLSLHHEDTSQTSVHHDSKLGEGLLAGAALGAGAAALAHHRNEDPGEGYQSPYLNRGLSPIQSVASHRESMDEISQHGVHEARSSNSLAASDKERFRGSKLSIGSLSSAPSGELARSRRSEQGLDGHENVLGYADSPRNSLQMDDFYEDQHRMNDEYRRSEDGDSVGSPKIDVRHMTNYTDDSMDAPYLDKVTAGREVVRGAATSPEYVHTPVAVESAVASLHDSSILDVPSVRSLRYSPERRSPRMQDSYVEEKNVSERGSPLKQQQDARDIPELSFHQRVGASSPPQSVTLSVDEREEHPQMGHTAIPGVGSPIPEIGYHDVPDDESDINTNPSIIQGPIGGLQHGNRDHWPYQPTPPQAQELRTETPDHKRELAAGLAGAAAGAGLAHAFGHKDQDYGDDLSIEERKHYMSPKHGITSPGLKDEGYISAANPRSAGAITPEPRLGGAGFGAYPEFEEESEFGDDPLATAHKRHLSGYSHGMPSPLYDSATGRGIDRIQSKDIVALMDHLTVRDAQRNARDTEILVTLVRSAAEMRNSFEDMKRFIQEQDDMMMDHNEEQHERTQKIIGGPRPLPTNGPRVKRSTEDVEDLQTKKKNVFKRALRGLSMKSTNDLGKIEDMLMQLLDEVEMLRVTQDGQSRAAGTVPDSLNSVRNLQEGYEPEGRAGTASDQSLFSAGRPMNEARNFSGRRDSAHRVSTVMEEREDEENLEPHEQDILDHQYVNERTLLAHQLEPTRPLSQPRMSTPPRKPVPIGSQSNENTPKIGSEKSSKHKHKSSGGTSFMKISRWSKTTASSFGDNLRNSLQPARRDRPSSEASRSGSDLHNGAYDQNGFYDPQGDDKLRSSYSLEQDGHVEDRPPSPLVPSTVSPADNPKYQAHRNSLNLQHPQPRQGPTDRYQSHLESQAQNFLQMPHGSSPITPMSDQWGSQPSLPPLGNNRYSAGSYPGGNRLSPISDAGYSDTSSVASSKPPPRPPKILDDGPLVPQRPPKVAVEGPSPPSNRQPTYLDHVSAARGNLSDPSTPLRKPSGPRPITTSGQYSPGGASRMKSSESITF